MKLPRWSRGKLINWMKYHNYTVSIVASMLMVDQSTVRRWLSGESKPNFINQFWLEKKLERKKKI